LAIANIEAVGDGGELLVGYRVPKSQQYKTYRGMLDTCAAVYN